MLNETGIFEDSELELPEDFSAINHGNMTRDTRQIRVNLERSLKGTTGLTVDLQQTPCSSFTNSSSEPNSVGIAEASAIIDSGYCNSIGSGRSETVDSVKYKHFFDSQRKEFVSRDDTESRDDDRLIFPCPKVRLLSAFDDPPSSVERKNVGTKNNVSPVRFSRSKRSGHRRSLDSYFNFDVEFKQAPFASRQLSLAHIDRSSLNDAVSDVSTKFSFSSHRKECGTFVRRRSVTDVVLSYDFTADKILHSTPVTTSDLSRRNVESDRMHTFSLISDTKPIGDCRLIDTEAAAFNTHKSSLSSIAAVTGSDARYRVRESKADSETHGFASRCATNEECYLTVDQQKELESVLVLFAPAVRDRLIGRKMGLESVDFIEELHTRSMTSILKIIFEKVNVVDLVQMRSISDVWMAAVDNDVTSQQRIKLWKTKTTISPNHKSATKENNDDCRKGTRKNLMTGTNQPLSLIQPKNTVSPTDTKKINCKVDLFLQEASKLKTGESLAKCSRCQHPARRDTAQERARCTSELCQFDFCTKCLRDFHGAERCDVGQNFRSDLKIGSQQSKNNLRRLLNL